MENQSATISMEELLVRQYDELLSWNAERPTQERWFDMLTRHKKERIVLSSEMSNRQMTSSAVITNCLTTNRVKIFQEIHEERGRQDQKWGQQNHPIRREDDADWYKQMSESYKGVCDAAATIKNLTWFDIAIEEFFEVFAEDTAEGQRHELLHVLGVMEAMVECIDRRQIG